MHVLSSEEKIDIIGKITSSNSLTREELVSYILTPLANIKTSSFVKEDGPKNIEENNVEYESNIPLTGDYSIYDPKYQNLVAEDNMHKVYDHSTLNHGENIISSSNQVSYSYDNIDAKETMNNYEEESSAGTPVRTLKNPSLPSGYDIEPRSENNYYQTENIPYKQNVETSNFIGAKTVRPEDFAHQNQTIKM